MIKLIKQYFANLRVINNLMKKHKCIISHRANFNLELLSQITIGENSSVGAGTIITTQSYKLPNKTKLIIGTNTYIGENNNIRVSDAEIIIGNNCLISQMVSLISANHIIPIVSELINTSGLDYNKIGIYIGNDVWIGTNSVILPGVKIGNGAVIGASSLININIPDNAIAVGNPAKIIKYRK